MSMQEHDGFYFAILFGKIAYFVHFSVFSYSHPARLFRLVGGCGFILVGAGRIRRLDAGILSLETVYDARATLIPWIFLV